MSFRLRVALVMALGIALSLLLQGLIGYWTFYGLVLGDIDRDLQEFTRRLTRNLERTQNLSTLSLTHDGYIVHARLMEGKVLYTNLTSFPPELDPDPNQTGNHTYGPWRVTETPVVWAEKALVLQTAITSPEFTAGLRNHRITMLFSALVVTVLGAGVAYALSGLALGPLRALTRASSRIAESGSLKESVLIPAKSTGEIHELAVSFNQMLQRLAEFRSREAKFNRQMAHELRTPLTAMRLSLDAARNGYSETEETLEVLDQELRRMQRLSNSILILSKEGRLAHLERVDLARLAQDAANLYAAAYQGPQSLTLSGDEVLIRRALENLLENARRHAAGAPARIVIIPQQGHAAVCVEDSGPGLPEDVLPHLTEEFYQAGNAPSGIGLGLSVVQQVMAAHQGQLHIENNQPHGLRVCLHFPLTS